MIGTYLNRVRERNPLVHNITNIVAANFAANALLAVGASPMMSSCHEEMAEMVGISGALTVNIGTLNAYEFEGMLLAGKAANRLGIPVVFDPVGVGATQHRQAVVKRFLDEVQCRVIRANAGEIAHLAGVAWQTRGVDAGAGEGNLKEIAETAAKRFNSLIVMTGAVDYITDGVQTLRSDNGTPLLAKITASGCSLTAVCGAFISVADTAEEALPALRDAALTFALAGERAARNLQANQNGSFFMALLDELASIDAKVLQEQARVHHG